MLDRVFAFADDVRAGRVHGATGKKLKSVVAVGIGGSYLGPCYVSEALQYDTHGARNREGSSSRFLSNIDPTCVAQALEGLDPERTLVVVVSKSWTTAETQRNAAQARDWLREGMASWRVSDDELVKKHFVACASADKLDAVAAWGIEPSRNFEFWDWVGGRYSTCASAGVLPLALVYGPAVVREFLAGAHSIDRHFASAPLERNLPALMALLGLWNANFLGFGARAVVPYADALRRFPAHVQQLEMESNGKAVTLGGVPLNFSTGEIVFGEPGTNSQHSFFQLLHMGQCVPCDFIGFALPQLNNATAAQVAAHDELMANFFAQPDALAAGKTFEEALNEEAGRCSGWHAAHALGRPPGLTPSSRGSAPTPSARRVLSRARRPFVTAATPRGPS